MKQAVRREALLMRQAAEGDETASRTLVKENLPKVLGLARKWCKEETEAEDLTQEVFLKLWEQAPRWEAKAAVSTWLYRVTLNIIYSSVRKKKTLLTLQAQEEEKLRASASIFPAAPAAVPPWPSLEKMESALKKLALHEQTILQLFYFEKKTLQELGEILDLKISAVESLLRRSRRRLKTILLNSTLDEKNEIRAASSLRKKEP